MERKEEMRIHSWQGLRLYHVTQTGSTGNNPRLKIQVQCNHHHAVGSAIPGSRSKVNITHHAVGSEMIMN